MKEYIAEYIIPVEKKGNDNMFDFKNAKRLIRCKDCRHAQKSVFKEKFKRCDYTMRLVNVDDFCSWAERKQV